MSNEVSAFLENGRRCFTHVQIKSHVVRGIYHYYKTNHVKVTKGKLQDNMRCKVKATPSLVASDEDVAADGDVDDLIALTNEGT